MIVDRGSCENVRNVRIGGSGRQDDLQLTVFVPRFRRNDDMVRGCLTVEFTGDGIDDTDGIRTGSAQVHGDRGIRCIYESHVDFRLPHCIEGDVVVSGNRDNGIR